MGIDLIAGGRKTKHKNRTSPKSKNVYLSLLVKVYRFLARRTDSKFNKIVLKRLFMSRVHQPPMSLKRIAKYMEGKEGKIAVIVAPVTNDVRLLQVPKLRICALKFTESVRARIVAAGGECLTFDQLALLQPTGENTVLLRGRTSARKATKYFGPSPGSKGSHTRPRVRSKGRKFERARMRK